MSTDTNTDAQDLGIEIARRCTWDGKLISEAFLEALTDANYHTLRAKLEPIIYLSLGE